MKPTILRRLKPLPQGFSLIEMLIAMMFIGILSAGMFRVYSSSLAGFQRVNDIIGNQRRGRWALASLQDDVASIGYFAMVPLNTLPLYPVGPGLQEPFMLLPASTPVVVTGPDPASPGALITAPLVPNPDELQFLSDIALPIQATLTASSTNSLSLNVKSGSLSDVRSGVNGDMVVVLDDTHQQARVDSISGNTIGLPVSADPSAVTQSQGNGITYSSTTTSAHQVDTPVLIYRPNIVTRFAIQPRAWDPSNPAITVPCLVRQQASYDPSGTLIDWAAGAAAGTVTTDVIAENVEGLVVDLSFDGGKTWVRSQPPAADWDTIVTRINAALSTLGATGTPARNAANPLWFRTYPFMVRLDVTSRSAAPRAGNAAAVGQADYVRRTQTLMITPRNFGLSLH